MSHATKPARLLVAERPQRARVPARIILAYAAAVYLFFLAVLGYAAGFLASSGVPKGIDQGPRAAAPAAAAIDLLLLLLFAVQHTVMARLMAGFVVIFWAAPVMTAGHLLFAATATGYILAGITFEEHDLIRSLGGTYAAYRARVPALIPRPSLRPRWPGAQRSEENDPKQVT